MKCTESSACSQESPDCVNSPLSAPDCKSNSKSRSSSRAIASANQYSSDITPRSPSTQTYAPSALNQDCSMSFVAEVPARIYQLPEVGRGLAALALACGLKCCGLLRKPDQILCFGKTWQAALITVYEQCLEDCEWQDIRTKIQSSYQQIRLERRTAGRGFLLLPTPMGHSRAKISYRHPGQDKLEVKLRSLGIVPTLRISSAEFREWMMGLPPGWTSTTEEDGGR